MLCVVNMVIMIVVGINLRAHNTMNIQHSTNRTDLTIYKNESNEN
jgi:uncharacterized sodium:solute symporter family permease YidK